MNPGFRLLPDHRVEDFAELVDPPLKQTEGGRGLGREGGLSR